MRYMRLSDIDEGLRDGWLIQGDADQGVFHGPDRVLPMSDFTPPDGSKRPQPVYLTDAQIDEATRKVKQKYGLD